jgi:hypothetical protein
MRLHSDLPAINIVHNFRSTCGTMGDFQVCLDPIYQVIFESSLDKLVQEIR